MIRPCLCVLVALLSACDPQGRANTGSADQRVVTEALPCLTLDSLTGDRLWYTDAIFGMRGTSGGTRLTLSPDTNSWVASLEPIWSDFPDEPNEDVWPRNAHALTLSWTDAAHSRIRFRRAQNPTGTDANGQPYDTALTDTWPDSMTAMLRCDEVVLMRWDGKKADTLRLERRSGPGS